MPRLRLIFLAVVLACAPGFKFRCYIFCSDQTSTQHDYVEQRDNCRDYAELKLDMEIRNQPGPVDEHKRKALLVSLFSQCMNENGWNVPGPESVGGSEAPSELRSFSTLAPPTPHQSPGAAVAPAAPAAALPIPSEQEIQARAALRRAAECNFARYAASTSSIARARAQACDIECEQRLKAAPDAPRPAACPAESPAGLERGREDAL